MDASSLSSSPCFVGEMTAEEDVNADGSERMIKFDIDDIPDLPFVSVVNTSDKTKVSNEALQRRIRILESNESDCVIWLIMIYCLKTILLL